MASLTNNVLIMHGPDCTVKFTKKGKIEIDFLQWATKATNLQLAILNFEFSQWYWKPDFVKAPFLEKLKKGRWKIFLIWCQNEIAGFEMVRK